MKIAVLGTGVVGQTLAEKLAQVGQEVMVGTRDPADTRARSEPGRYGQPPFHDWLERHPSVRLGTYAEAARFGEAVINATLGEASLDALHAAGEDNLNGKILIDISIPLDFSQGMPPSLFVCNTDSLGEQIQRAFPRALVVKTLNTITAALMVDPGLVGGGEHTIFLSGDDVAAKAQVREWLAGWFGWKDILDLGDITTSRGVEMYLPLWLRLWGATGSGIFNIRVVK
jgi:8-hydroxy-5-deazaflavin:NADPH oxidoreductase